jgi:hypothetical protein
MTYEALDAGLRERDFRYWCFISWATGGRELQVFVERLQEALYEEFKNLFPVMQDVFLSSNRVRIGHAWENELGDSLSRSVCLIAVLTPPYFASSHSYCGREWAAMTQLSAERFGPYVAPGILPVTFRECEEMPDVARRLQHRDISRVALQTRDVHKTQHFRKLVNELVAATIVIGKSTVQQAAHAGTPDKGSGSPGSGSKTGGSVFRLPENSAFGAMSAVVPRLPFE